VRLSLALLMLSAGVPMITGGTEFGRTQFGNNNPFNLDIAANWLDWSLPATNAALLTFTQTLIEFRRAHLALRPTDFFTGQVQPNGIKDLTWLKPDGSEVDSGYFVDQDNHFLAWQLDGSLAADPARRIFIAYNGWINTVLAVLPALPPGQAWKLAMDTSRTATGWGNIRPPGQEAAVQGMQYELGGRSCILAIC
jgi:isoamylase